MRGASEPVEELRKRGGHEGTRNAMTSQTKATGGAAIRRGHAQTMYEVTSRKGGQRQQPYGRPCATVREVRDNSRTAMDLLDLHVHRLQKKKPAGPIAKRKQQQT